VKAQTGGQAAAFLNEGKTLNYWGKQGFPTVQAGMGSCSLTTAYLSS
jgi:hypothetical protein